MSNPSWIDQELSKELPVLRDGGEGQHVEFKESYPSNGNDLSREIAAFASSNPGKVLVGISDDGGLVGLPELVTAEGRDRLCRRIEGLCTNNVRPAITPIIKFAEEGGLYVLAIEVPRGGQPIYYSGNTPYVRHLSSSRPAEPHEVIEHIQDWLGSNPLASPEADREGRFISELASALVDVLIYREEFERRNVNPWLDLMRSQFAASAEELRRLAAENMAAKHDVDVRLRSVADKLDAASAHRLTMGTESWQTLAGYVHAAFEEARELKADLIDDIPMSADSKEAIHETVLRTSRELMDLAGRAPAMAQDGRLEQLQDKASQLGRNLLIASLYSQAEDDSRFAIDLEQIGHELHLVETERVHMDGGVSVQRIVDRIDELGDALQRLFVSS